MNKNTQDSNPTKKCKKKKSKILVFDESDINEFVLKKMLESEGYSVKYTNNALDAENLFSKNEIDLAIIDLFAANLDGYELYSNLKDRGLTEQMPIILTSGIELDKINLRMKRNELDMFLIKPFDKNELISRIKNSLQEKNHRIT